jgi:uncharacterized protein DUF4190
MAQQTAYPPQFGYRTPVAAPQPVSGTNGLAVASLVISLHSIGLPGVSIVGAILGHVARGQIRRTGDDGAGAALAGIVIGWSVTALYVVLLAAVILIVVLAN